MTDEQFKALAELLRLRAGPAQTAARLVLVGGLSVPDAARSAGIEYIAAHKAVKRAERGLTLVNQVLS